MALFPGHGFQESAATPVFLGVLLCWLLTETLGWSFAGLVVPGYLATVFIVEPRSATIDVVEACLTYLAARTLGEHASQTGLTSRAFGRERFFLLVAVSVLVRVIVEGLVLPRALAEPSWAYSIGLVVVPLAANACWKPGLVGGLVQKGLPTLAVYVCLRFVLLPHTNLSLQGFHLLTEDVAASFLGSPKAYFVLLTGAMLASYANVRWGWDFGGILIPALLGLVAAEPRKLVTTGVEALVLVAVVRGLQRFTRVGRWNIEGPRRIVLFFTCDYALRFGLGWALDASHASFTFADTSGLGYLLPSILAVKVAQRRNAALVLVPTAATALAAFGLGSAIAFALDGVSRRTEDAGATSAEVDDGSTRYVQRARVAVRWSAALARRGPSNTAGADVQSLAFAMHRALLRPDAPLPAELFLRKLDDGVCWVGERVTSLDARRGAPQAFQRCREPGANGVVLLLDAPLRSPAAARVAGVLLETRAVAAIVVGGSERTDATEETGTSVARQLAERIAERMGRVAVVVAVDDGSTDGTSSARGLGTDTLDRLRAAANLALLADGGATDRAALHVAPGAAADALPAGTKRVDATGSAAAFELDGATPESPPLTAEARLVLRRLVLEPVLSEHLDSAHLALATDAARDFGFDAASVKRGHLGDHVLVLAPTKDSPHLGLVARTDGAGDHVVTLDDARRASRRRFATGLATGLRARALLVGFPLGDTTNSEADEALAVATLVETRDRPTVLVRVGRDEQGLEPRVALGTWSPGEAGSANDIRRWLDALALASVDAPLTPTELARAMRHQPRPLETRRVAPNDAALRAFAASIQSDPLSTNAAIATRDGGCDEALLELATRPPSRTASPSFDLRGLLSAALAERSITAQRGLERALDRDELKLARARADSGILLAGLAKTRAGGVVVCEPVATHQRSRDSNASQAPSLPACARAVARGGSCTFTEGLP